MRIETDIKIIEQLSKQREDANWEFCCFLKRSGIPSSRIDGKVHDLRREISEEIDCTRCGNCCKVATPHLTSTDITRLAHQLRMTAEEFKSQLLKKDGDDEDFAFNAQPCPLLKDSRCEVYEVRPYDCRSFPHLHKRDFIHRLNQAVSNCSICPIVFNVYEGLKGAFRGSSE